MNNEFYSRIIKILLGVIFFLGVMAIFAFIVSNAIIEPNSIDEKIDSHCLNYTICSVIAGGGGERERDIESMKLKGWEFIHADRDILYFKRVGAQ